LASLSSKERKALWMKLRDAVLERALPRLAHDTALGTALGCLATMAGTRIMRRRILRSGDEEKSQDVEREHRIPFPSPDPVAFVSGGTAQAPWTLRWRW